MPVNNIESKWSGGNLYFYEKAVGRSVTGDVLSMSTSAVTIGGTSQDIDFAWYATGSKSFVLDAGAGTLTIAGVDVSLTGDLTIDTEDINLGDDDDLEFGDSQDVLLRFSTGDASNHAFVVALDDTSQQMHITDKGAVATDWNRSAGTHPEVSIHSNTTPATDYLAIGNHDGTTAHINVVGGTTLSLDIAGTAEVLVTASATTPATTDSNALGSATLMWSDLFLASGAVINFDNGNATITHSTGLLTLGSAGLSIGTSGAGYDVTFYGDTASCNFLWDQNLDTNGGLQLGADTKSVSFYAYGLTTGNYLKWDGAADDLLLVGTATQLGIAGTTDASSTTTGSIHTAGGLGVAKKAYIGTELVVGVSGTGADATFYGAVANYKIWFDANGDTNGAMYFGADTYGIYTKWFGDTTGYYIAFDPSGDTNGAWYFGANTKGIQVNLYGDVTGCGVFWDPSTDTNGTLSIGASGGSKGNDVLMYGATNGSYAQWDQSEDQFKVVQTNAATSGTERSFDVSQTHTGIGASAEALRSVLTSNVALGSYGNAIFGKIDLQTTGLCAGLIGVVCGELTMPGGTIAGGAGTYSVFEAEINCPTSYDSTVPIHVFQINAWGAAVGKFDDYGYLFDLTGVTSGADHIWYDNQKAAPAVEEFIRVKTPAGVRYIGLYNANA